MLQDINLHNAQEIYVGGELRTDVPVPIPCATGCEIDSFLHTGDMTLYKWVINVLNQHIYDPFLNAHCFHSNLED